MLENAKKQSIVKNEHESFLNHWSKEAAFEVETWGTKKDEWVHRLGSSDRNLGVHSLNRELNLCSLYS